MHHASAGCITERTPAPCLMRVASTWDFLFQQAVGGSRMDQKADSKDKYNMQPNLSQQAVHLQMTVQNASLIWWLRLNYVDQSHSVCQCCHLSIGQLPEANRPNVIVSCKRAEAACTELH